MITYRHLSEIMKFKSAFQNPKLAVIIVGAGPAGASAAIRLANLGFGVTLIEREKFPRHKLCGEFVSPECLRHFRDLCVYEKMRAKGGEQISKTVFYNTHGNSFEIPSAWFGNDESALGISRSAMDLCLLNRARESGVEILEESRAVGLTFDNQRVIGVKTKSSDGKSRELFSELIIDATGRARVLSKLLENQFQPLRSKSHKTKPTHVAFKAHFEDVKLPRGVCEIYFFRGGYGGLNYVEDGAANQCFIVKADFFRENGSDAEEFFREVIMANVRARATMSNALRKFDWQAVAIESFGFQDPNPTPNFLSVGDAGAFIDPFTGSGILMALESSELVAKAALSSARIAEIGTNYALLHREKFRTRIRASSLWRRAAFSPRLVSYGVKILGNPMFPRRWLAATTRSRTLQTG